MRPWIFRPLPSHRLPVLGAVGFGVGARVGCACPGLGEVALALALALLGGVVAGMSRGGGRATLVRFLFLASLLPAGTAWGAWRELERPPDALAGLDGASVLLRGSVCRPEGVSSRSCRLFVRVEWLAVRTAAGWQRLEEGGGATVLVRVPASRGGRRGGTSLGMMAPARWGDRVVVSGILRDPLAGPNPMPSYAAWLALYDVLHVVVARHGGDVSVLVPGRRPWALAVAIPLRRALEETLDRALPPTEAALLKGIVLAEGNALPEEVAAPFRATGTWHVMVTAGLHVNVAISLFAALLGWLRLPGRRAALLCLPLVAAYALAVGGSPSVTRAAIMGSATLVGHACGRRSDSLAALGVAVIAMVAWDPRVTCHVGFHMSLACVVGIATLGRALRLRLRGVPRALRPGVAATVSTQMAVAPLAAACFGTVSLTAVVANVVVVPLCEAALAGGLLVAVGGAVVSCLAGGAAPGLADGVAAAGGWPLALLLRLVTGCVQALGVLPGSELPAEAPGWRFTMLYWGSLGVLARMLAPPRASPSGRSGDGPARSIARSRASASGNSGEEPARSIAQSRASPSEGSGDAPGGALFGRAHGRETRA